MFKDEKDHCEITKNVRKKYVTCNGIMCVFIRLEIREKRGVRDNSYVSSLNNLEENNDNCTTRGCDILSPALADLPNHIFTIWEHCTALHKLSTTHVGSSLVGKQAGQKNKRGIRSISLMYFTKLY